MYTHISSIIYNDNAYIYIYIYTEGERERERERDVWSVFDSLSLVSA